MREGILGKKLGMTQVFTEDGQAIPVTIVEAGPCRVVDLKSRERDGYDAAQLGFGEVKKEKRLTKPMAGHFRKNGVPACRHLTEVPTGELKVGDELTVEMFEPGSRVTVVGKSIGKGFQGVMKRHNYRGGPATHGAKFHREPGSIGMCAWPSRVFKNVGMPGRMGGEKVTLKNVEVIDVKTEQNLLLLKGGVPGSKGSLLFIGKGGR